MVAYDPHSGQRALHRSNERHRILSCGRRWGKSTAGGHELTPYALLAHTEMSRLLELGQQRRYWIVGPNYDDAEREWRVFYDDAKKLKLPMERPGTYNDTRGGNMMMTLWEGRCVIECRSADHEESLDGEGLDGVLLVEAAKMKHRVWTKFIRPALSDKRGWSLHTSTPEGRNWFYDHWRRGQDEAHPDWWSARMPSWTNDVIFPGGREDPEIIAMEADMSKEKFNQEVGAEFTEFVGRVFKEFEEETHVRTLNYDPRWPVYLALDYGFTNPFVALVIQVDTWDNVYILREYRRTQMTIDDIAKDLKGEWDGLATKARYMYPDPAGPGETRVLERALKVSARGNVGGPTKDRLELIRQWLRPMPEHVPVEQREPRMFVDRSCVDLIAEMADKYRYPEKRSEESAAKEEPMKVDDHGPEALGRFMRGYFGAPGTDGRSGRARVSRANVSTGKARRPRVSA